MSQLSYVKQCCTKKLYFECASDVIIAAHKNSKQKLFVGIIAMEKNTCLSVKIQVIIFSSTVSLHKKKVRKLSFNTSVLTCNFFFKLKPM